MAEARANNHALVTIEVAGSNGERQNIAGVMRESTGKSLILTSGQDLPAAARVNVRTEDRLYFGEVLKSIPEQGAKWTIHVLTKRALMIV